MDSYAPAVERLIEQFHKLPGVGRKSAVRMAFYILGAKEETAAAFAEAVVEAYVRAENCLFAPRNPVLCGYERVLLKPGESKRVRVAVNPDAFTAVNEAGERVSAGDRFTLWLGGGQPDARTEALSGERAAVLSIHR